MISREHIVVVGAPAAGITASRHHGGTSAAGARAGPDALLSSEK